MEFSLLHTGLAAGATLAAIPVILHLILRQKPRHEPFPALRLIRLRHRVNLRKLRIRHWLLLALRMLLIALMAFALARPSIHGASFIPDQQAPVAAALVFDTSLSMEYRDRDRTRLEAAQEIARELLKEFSDGSEVMVLDSADPSSQFFPDLSLAEQRIGSIRLRPRAKTLNQAVIEACRGLQQSDRTRKEIYIFTDLAADSLALDGADELKKSLESVKEGAAVYLVNLGIENPRNAFIAEATPSAEVIPANTGAIVYSVVQDSGHGEDAILELMLDGQTRGTQQVALERNQAARAEFRLPRLMPGVHQGKLVLRNGGNIEFDDTRYITIEVRPITRVLLVSDDPRDAIPLKHALAPPDFVDKQIAYYHCDAIDTARLAGTRLTDYSVVALINVAQLPSPRWRELEEFVMSGGGLGVFLGGRTQIENYNQDIAQTILPLKLERLMTPTEPLGLTAPMPSHPVTRKIHEWDASALSQAVIERYVRAELVGKNSRQVITYSDGSIALAERMLGGSRPGRVAMLTTAVHSSIRPVWNDLPQFAELFVILADNLTSYLAGHAEQRLNYAASEDVILQPDRDQKFGVYLLHTPDSDQPTRRSADPGEGSVVVPAPEALGNYRVRSGQGEQTFEKGFSVNPSADESRLEPLSPTELAALFGEGNYAAARSIDELRRVMGRVRIGRELFPWLMPILVLLFAAEHLLANRFYRSEPQRDEAIERRIAAPAAKMPELIRT